MRRLPGMTDPPRAEPSPLPSVALDEPHLERARKIQMIRGLRRELVEIVARDDAASFADMAPLLADLLGGCDLQTIWLLLQPVDHPEATGLPCPDCGAKQDKITMRRDSDGALFLRLSAHAPAASVKSELAGMIKLLKGWKDQS